MVSSKRGNMSVMHLAMYGSANDIGRNPPSHIIEYIVFENRVDGRRLSWRIHGKRRSATVLVHLSGYCQEASSRIPFVSVIKRYCSRIKCRRIPCRILQVIAQLVIDGKLYGIHNFIVPIRGDDHRPLPGVR